MMSAYFCHSLLLLLTKMTYKKFIHLDISIYDKNCAEKLEARWKSGKMEYEEIIITQFNGSGKYWKIIDNTKMKHKGIIRGIIDRHRNFFQIIF